jgi:hypothetical protein
MPDDLHALPTIAYLSDAEGLWSKLVSFTEGNPCVRLDEAGHLQVAPGCIFVFGGDAIDRGPSSRRIVATLLEARERQPDQVVLLAGNRDINKLRLPRELTGQPPRRAPEEIRQASRADLLRWIFSNTMGAKMAFEARRSELRAEGADSSDEAVVESYLTDLSPTGPMTRYLAACQLAYRSGATLFVHGGVTHESLGRVPGEDRTIEGVDPWVRALNGWYQQQIGAFLAGEIGPRGEVGWAPLVAYQAPLPGTRLNQASVVYGRPTDDEGNPGIPGHGVVEALAASGVRRLVVGHTPVGDSPALVRNDRFELLAADNSYSPVESGSRVFVRDDELTAIGHTRLEPGGQVEEVRFTLAPGDPSLIGHRVGEAGHLVKGRLSSGDYLLHRSLPNFQVDQRAIEPHALGALRLTR